MGGPALHVAYLTAGLATAATRRRSSRGRSRAARSRWPSSPSELGVPIVHASPSSTARSRRSATCSPRSGWPTDPPGAPAHPAHAHGQGRGDRPSRRAARWRRAPADRRPHVPRARAPGLLRPGARDRVFRLLERWLARSTTALVAVSPQVRDDLVALGVAPRRSSPSSGSASSSTSASADGGERAGGDEARARDLARPLRRRLDRPDDRREAHRRRAARASARLRERGVDAVLCMVGDGPDRELVEKRGHELGIVRDMPLPRLPGRRRAVLRRVRRADPARRANEGTPVSAIEALAAGGPVVATRVGGVPDVVRDGVDGYLVEPGDVEAMADRLALLAADPPLRTAWARPAASLGTRALFRRAPPSTTSTVSIGHYSAVEPAHRVRPCRHGVRPREGVRSVRKALEGRRRASSGRGGLEARLPAGEVRLVPEQEPEHQLDARVPAGDGEGLRQVRRLLRPGDAEEPVRRVCLPAVLGDPDRLGP